MFNDGALVRQKALWKRHNTRRMPIIAHYARGLAKTRTHIHNRRVMVLGCIAACFITDKPTKCLLLLLRRKRTHSLYFVSGATGALVKQLLPSCDSLKFPKNRLVTP